MNADHEDLPSFKGKTVTFYATGFQTLGTIVAPSFERQADRWFLVGEAATSSGHWAEGALAAIAWDHVCSYIVLDSNAWMSQRAKREHGRDWTSKSAGGFWRLWGPK